MSRERKARKASRTGSSASGEALRVSTTALLPDGVVDLVALAKPERMANDDRYRGLVAVCKGGFDFDGGEPWHSPVMWVDAFMVMQMHCSANAGAGPSSCSAPLGQWVAFFGEILCGGVEYLCDIRTL